MDASPIPVSMSNDSALTSRWYWSFCHRTLYVCEEAGTQRYKVGTETPKLCATSCGGVPLARFRLHRGERFRYEYDFTADWKLDLRLERVLPFDPKCALPSCTGGSRAAPPEDCAGAWAYLQRLDEHKSRLPLEELSLMAEAVRRWLDAEGDRRAIGDLDELREAIDRVEAYQAFRPDRFDRRALNRQLRTLAHDREVRP